jgi:hypothetical protein
MGIVIVLCNSYKRSTREDGYQWNGEKGVSHDSLFEPKHASFQSGTEPKELSSFTPLPSPNLAASSNRLSVDNVPLSGITGSKFLRPFHLRASPGSNAKGIFCPQHLISRPMKLVSSRRGGNEVLKENSADGSIKQDNNDTSWFGKVSSLFGKGQAGRAAPALDDEWLPPPIMPQQHALLPRPKMERRLDSIVPTDVTREDDLSSALPTAMDPTPFPRPVHYGFVPIESPSDQPSKQRITSSAIYFRTDEHHLQVPSMNHRRSSSVPGIPVSPTTRLLTQTHARKSSSIDPANNPFATPFDDEYAVTAHARKSSSADPTNNPFATPFDDEHAVTGVSA